MNRHRFHGLSLCVLVALCSSGCNLNALVVKATADGTKEFTDKHGTEFADPEMIGPVLANSVVTNEGFLYYAPDYEPLLQAAIFANVAYGVAFLGGEAHELELNGKFDEAEKIGLRQGLLYTRAFQLSKRMLRLRDDGFDTAIAAGLPQFKRWIDDNFYEKRDAEVLLTAGVAYFVSMFGSAEGLAAAVDVPYAKYMVERSVQLDPTVMGGQGLTVLGIYQCTLPEMVGGDPRLGLALLTRAAEITNRQSHGVLVQIAERCAVALQDRKLYHDVLMEVIQAPDVPKYRLTNKLARHEAERLLKQMGEFFYD